MTPINYRAAVSIVVLLYGIWRFRRNKVLALGAITLGVAAFAFALSKVRGLPDSLLGDLVVIFLILSVVVLLLPVFYVAKWFIGKLRRRNGEVGTKAPTP